MEQEVEVWCAKSAASEVMVRADPRCVVCQCQVCFSLFTRRLLLINSRVTTTRAHPHPQWLMGDLDMAFMTWVLTSLLSRLTPLPALVSSYFFHALFSLHFLNVESPQITQKTGVRLRATDPQHAAPAALLALITSINNWSIMYQVCWYVVI